MLAGAASQILRNAGPVSNTVGPAPTGLRAAINGSTVQFSWNAGSDAETPAAGLTYNLRVGTTPGGSDVLSPNSDPVTGFRRLPQFGNAWERLSTTLTNLTNGFYYWSVQSVDTGLAGSPFAPEQKLAVGFLYITGFDQEPAGGFQVHFNAGAGLGYTLWSSTNLTQWNYVTNAMAATNGPFQLTDTTHNTDKARFYRLSQP